MNCRNLNVFDSVSGPGNMEIKSTDIVKLLMKEAFDSSLSFSKSKIDLPLHARITKLHCLHSIQMNCLSRELIYYGTAISVGVP